MGGLWSHCFFAWEVSKQSNADWSELFLLIFKVIYIPNRVWVIPWNPDQRRPSSNQYEAGPVDEADEDGG